MILGRLKEYHPRSPAEIIERTQENRCQEYEGFRRVLKELRDPFLAEFRPRLERASEAVMPTEELFSVVNVGEPSEFETQWLYYETERAVNVITTSFEYFESIEPAFADAIGRGIDIDILLLHPRYIPSGDRPVEEDRRIQREIDEFLDEEYPSVGVRFSTDPLPWRGTLVDPSMDYETGQAVLLVEEPNVPDSMRQAAVTENGSFVAGMARYFELIWEHESVAEYPGVED